LLNAFIGINVPLSLWILIRKSHTHFYMCSWV